MATACFMSKIPASRPASFIYLQPVVAIVIAWAWLGETPTLVSLAGVILVNTWGRRDTVAIQRATDMTHPFACGMANPPDCRKLSGLFVFL
jgi:hypothetical protein